MLLLPQSWCYNNIASHCDLQRDAFAGKSLDTDNMFLQYLLTNLLFVKLLFILELNDPYFHFCMVKSVGSSKSHIIW